MAYRRDGRKIISTIQAEARKLDARRVDKLTGEFSKADERAIRAALKRLDKAVKELKQAYHPWEFGRPK